MFLTVEDHATTYIANYRFWKSTYRKDEEKFFRYLVTCLSHESLHLALFGINKTASRRIDRRHVFGDLTSQEHPIGLRLPLRE